MYAKNDFLTPLQRTKRYLRQFPALVKLRKKYIPGLFDDRITKLDVTKAFPLFRPNSSGHYEDTALLTINTINGIFPALSSFCLGLNDRQIVMSKTSDFSRDDVDLAAASDLKILFDKHGSDKANSHGYHLLYGSILKDKKSIKAVLEVGLGTNNVDVVSNMGKEGKPGASLRAFRDFLPDAHVFGADFDRRIFFKEERIDTFYVDQTNANSFVELESRLPIELDLVIDDGLHSPDANINTLRFGLKKIRRGGWVVIEDIALAARPFWEMVSCILPDHFRSRILIDNTAILFVVQRLV